MATKARSSSDGVTESKSANWHATTLDPRTIEREFAKLWETQEERSRRKGPGNDVAELRTSTVNLIAVAEQSIDAARLEETVRQLRDFAPTRAVVLLIDAEHDQAGIEVEATVREIATERGRAPIRFEIVRVTAGPEGITSLASIASPLLVPELPTFLFWSSSSLAGNHLFSELSAISDRLIIDSSILSAPDASMRTVASTLGSPRAPIVSDFAWRRLNPWRSLLAQFFDHPDTLPALDRIEEIELVSRAADGEGPSGETGSLLLAGWLASSLDWRIPGPLVRTSDGWRVTLRGGTGAEEREILLRLRHRTQVQMRGRILSVTLRAEGETTPSIFSIERLSEGFVRTHSEPEGAMPTTRSVPAAVFTNEVLLSRELASLGRDSNYENALRFAVRLMPEGT
jgi:glucose-6-phosphate dehydrogenase assembly protein OpcA